ncbi:MAG: DMT family transporter [Dongiaceae bacterium]
MSSTAPRRATRYARDGHGPFMRWVVPLFCLVIMGAAWGGNTAIAKVAALAGASALGLVQIEAIGSGLTILAICIATRRVPPISRTHLGFYTIAGLLGMMFPGAMIFWIAPYIPVGILALLFTLVPMTTYGLSLLFTIERLVWIRLLGLVIGLIGTALVILPGAGLPGAHAVGWTMIGLVVPALYSLQNVYIAAKWPGGADPLAISCGTLICGGIAFLPVVLIPGEFMTMAPPWGTVEWSAIALLTLNALATSIFMWLLRFAGAVFASQTAYFVTLWGILWGMIIYDEQHSLMVWLAAALLFLGVALVTVGERLTQRFHRLPPAA